MACSEPPKGRKRWTLQRLEQQVVELRIVDRASDNTIGRTLNKPCPAASAEAMGHPTGCQRRGPSHGELSIMVGATPEPFSLTQPILETMGTDVTHCGPVGCGQVVKILNNMSVFQHCGALAEAIAIGRRNGVPADVLLPTIAMGPGDSFVLRNHGMKAMLAERLSKTGVLDAVCPMRWSGQCIRPGRDGWNSRGRLKRAVEAGYRDHYTRSC